MLGSGRKTFTESAVAEEFDKKGVPQTNLSGALQMLILYSLLDQQEGQFVFRYPFLIEILQREEDIDSMIEELEETTKEQRRATEKSR